MGHLKQQCLTHSSMVVGDNTSRESSKVMDEPVDLFIPLDHSSVSELVGKFVSTIPSLLNFI